MADELIISIVDDDESMREAVEDLVSSLGWVACSYDSAETFLQSGELYNTACLITDEQMPGMKGHELQHQLRERGHAMPIIFITAFPESCKYQPEENGTVTLLQKPFDGKSLVQCLRNVMARD